jgi:hypothetical protein
MIFTGAGNVSSDPGLTERNSGFAPRLTFISVKDIKATGQPIQTEIIAVLESTNAKFPRIRRSFAYALPGGGFTCRLHLCQLVPEARTICVMVYYLSARAIILSIEVLSFRATYARWQRTNVSV